MKNLIQELITESVNQDRDIKEIINEHDQKEQIIEHLVETTRSETPEASFDDGLFEAYTLGSQLVQTPFGANAIVNTKKTK